MFQNITIHKAILITKKSLMERMFEIKRSF